jgi:hypothetical protein
LNKEIRLTKLIAFQTTTDYKSNKQCIFGLTITKSEHIFSSSGLYDDIDLKQNEYNLNLWLFLISFHFILRGKKRKVKPATL